MPTVVHYDDQGNVAFSTNTDAVNDPFNVGFGSAFVRFLQSGIYNGGFQSLPLDVTQNIDNVNNPLPCWTQGAVGSGATTCQMFLASDSAQAYGYALEIDANALATTDELYIEQMLPVITSRALGTCFAPQILCAWNSPDTNGRIKYAFQFIKSDQVTTTGSGESGTVSTTNNSGSWSAVKYLLGGVTANANTPSDAAYVRLRVGIAAAVGATSAKIRIYSADNIGKPSFMALGDQVGTHAPSWLSGNFGPTFLAFGASSSVGFSQTSGTDPTNLTNLLLWNGSNLQFPDSAIIGGGGNNNLAITGDVSVRAAATGVFVNQINAGTPTDSIFAGAASTGGGVVDTTAVKWWCRTNTATWKGVALAGERVPSDERQCPECLRRMQVGDELVLVANEWHADGDLHGFWKHRDCGFGWRLLKRLGLVRSRVAEVTARLHEEERWRAENWAFIDEPPLRLVA